MFSRNTNISKKVIAVVTSVIKENKPQILKGFGGSLELTEGWALNVLKNLDWVKLQGTTGKLEPCAKF